MKLNNQYRFDLAPTVTTPRSKFLMHQNIRTTFNAGVLVPFYCDSDIMPGDTFKVSGTIVCRQSTPIYPTMDNSFLDVVFMKVPYRLVWDHFKEFMGENNTGAWTQTNTYTIPQLKFGNSTLSLDQIQKGAALNYMGIPLNLPSTSTGYSISALPLRAYALCWNEWFRDENVCPPMYIYKGDSDTYLKTGIGNSAEWGTYDTTYYNYFTQNCAPVYKFKDYLNSCLPEPQKGSPVTLPIGDYAEVLTTDEATYLNTANSGSSPATYGYGGLVRNISTNEVAQTYASAAQDGKLTNLYADLSNAVAATINAQRMAFAAQRILEQSARAGTRYTELTKAFFGTSAIDDTLQRPELLAHVRIPITMNQVPQTSSTDNTSPQGNVAAYSLTIDGNHYFTKSFTEHCIILGLMCVRQEHSYDQGIPRQWSRVNKLDFYWPQLAFLGEQAVLNKEIYAQGNSYDNQVFGYNERWAELRYKTNINTGAFSTQYATSLDAWHYGDSYSALPVLSDAWRRETKDYIDRTLAVTSAVEDQYILDSRWEIEATRPIPMYSIPGLLDHF